MEKNFQDNVANILLNIESVKFSFKKPFTLTSGLDSPVYVDCRKIISFVKEREIIMNSIKNVIDVLSFNDDDSTCIDGIRKAISIYSNHDLQFANGGDRNQKATPELDFCNKNNIELLWGIGGEEKSNSSSWILKKWEEKK